MARRISAAVALLALSSVPAWAQEGYFTDFEGGSASWSFQQIDQTVKWTVDATPTVFVSPTQTLNNIDNLTSSVATASSVAVAADAYSPTAFFAAPGTRFIKHWCRYQFIQQTGFHAYRWMKVGPQLLIGEVILTIFYNDLTISDGGDACGSLNFRDTPVALAVNSFIIDCPSRDWHEHVFIADQTGVDMVHNTVPVPASGAQAGRLGASTILQAGFFFEWKGDPNCAIFGGFGGAAFTGGGSVAWMLDDLFLSSSLFDPFGPEPQPQAGAGGGGGGGGSGGFDCIAGVIPVGNGPGGLLGALLGAAALAAAGGNLKRRIESVVA